MILPCPDEFPKNPTPVAEMRVADDVISEVFVGVDDGLTDGGGADVPDMEGFAGVGTDIIDDDRLISSWFILGREIGKEFCPGVRRQAKIHVSAEDGDIMEVIGSISDRSREAFGDRGWGEVSDFGERKDSECEVAELTAGWDIERELWDRCLGKGLNHNI